LQCLRVIGSHERWVDADFLFLEVLSGVAVSGLGVGGIVHELARDPLLTLERKSCHVGTSARARVIIGITVRTEAYRA
jgi:hypothetical protein